ncbi:MAG: hypothetical protein L0H53_16930 [Candidatus Nitrosocosmicus sp.]|nr:hypothetical protein [Candidatus Nitrosocosmicus sp.]MDN5868866.1 hypothetical protein [Candidatus Nitrosocosmicus sp.]
MTFAFAFYHFHIEGAVFVGTASLVHGPITGTFFMLVSFAKKGQKHDVL